MATRREFLRTGLIGLSPKTERRVAGSFVNDSVATGHALRDGGLQHTPKQSLRVPVVIIGGGIAGLSAAWHLNRRGLRDFVLLEMESQPGGNSRWGQNDISAYPWAAHYVPVPDNRAILVRELMEELGVLQQGTWNERYLCFSPQERVYIHGRWEEEIDPSGRDEGEWRRFLELMAEFRGTGQFTIPMDAGIRPSPLDRISMQDWMLQNRFQSRYLQWYVDYACRDDYGAHATATSAWAGIHYFTSRASEEKGPLTWPEGNGWIVRRLVQNLEGYVRTGQPVLQVRRDGRTLRVLTPQVEYTASIVIFAAPTFLAARLIEGARRVEFQYSPWVTANLTLDRMPREKGLETAWDNVIYGSPSLGYVDAAHMSLQSRRERTVWTWYYAFADSDIRAQRQFLLMQDWQYWKEFILTDLARAHPDIRECVSRIDVMRFGHAMARPVPGAIFSEQRLAMARPSGRIIYANSDLSGYSIFEEAQYRGVRAASVALKLI